MTISKAKANKIIKDCFYAIPEIHHGWNGTVREILYKMELAAEKQHRNGRTVSGFSAGNAAMYFTVQHLFNAVQHPSVYNVVDILHVRTECLYAQAYAIEYAEKLQSWKDYMEASEFNLVDYTDMMK